MRNDRYKHTGHKDKGKKQGNKSNPSVNVTLPYDFVPFAEEENRIYPYECTEQNNNLPKHNDFQGLSGTIDYEITPYSDLAIEVRTTWNEELFFSGSSIRGKIRSNAEILSASYPEFIDRSEMVYRDISSPLYRNRAQSQHGIPNRASRDLGIERTIQVGFLRKIGNQFYVTPAKKFDDKYFLSIKEHRLMHMGVAGKQYYSIYEWNNKNIIEFNNLQSEIEKKTKQIKLKRELLKGKLNIIEGEITKIFTDIFSLFKKLGDIKIKGLDHVKDQLLLKLKEIKPYSLTEKELFLLHELYQLYADRWGCKVKMYLMYNRLRPNEDFIPYQRSVYYKKAANKQGIEYISTNHSTEVKQKGYLFNSTNASSKRSHYFVLGPNDELKNEYLVPQSVINGYNRNLKKFRITNSKRNDIVKSFYNIFDNYEAVIQLMISSNEVKEEDAAQGVIVFYHSCEPSVEKEIVSIGRTPYFKVPYKNQLEDLIGVRENGKLDYANALFGFAPDSQRKEPNYHIAYKSRLRFSPVDIPYKGTFEPEVVKDFVLMTPSATANGMYIQQNEAENITYEDDEVKLNGYKYYHVLKEHIVPTQKTKQIEQTSKEDENTSNMFSTRKVLKADELNKATDKIRGKVYFRNLSDEELGLLLLSLDWREVLTSKKYSENVTDLKALQDKSYELIGGAKPYGYGKVKIEIKSLQLEKKGNDFDSLILNPTEAHSERAVYIDQFITVMGGEQYFKKNQFKPFIQSKLEKSFNTNGDGTVRNPKHVNWDNITEEIGKEKRSGKGGGYPKSWRLSKSKSE
ncbi:hypothetical protein [Paenibacillus sp. 481]|uniref:hypothetical protein n=1 Tax=Paenibacillus sp. 481 TaxID=2835869 RepID=UPI001E5C7D6E|nr:hypothetical protein [Paenibacillus sp. 481]UHA72133.1 hypothetical protein KIK04_15665 [Paenibacillus sp. 481]